MRYLLATGAWIVGLAMLFPACGVEDHTTSPGGVEAPQKVGTDALVVPSGESESCSQVDSWVEANHAKLPTDYDELGLLPMTYRRALFGSLSRIHVMESALAESRRRYVR